MLEQIKELLIRGIDAEKLIQELSLHFTESLEDELKKDPELQKYLESSATLKEFFQNTDPSLSETALDLIDDLYADLDYGMMYQFDLVEDSVKEELLHGRLASSVVKDMRRGGITFLHPSEPLNEDQVEEYYVEAFRDFDELRLKIFDSILAMSPGEFFQMGKDARDSFRKARGLQMDEQDFNRQYLETLDKDRLRQLFAKKIYDSIHYHSRYVLENVSDEEEDDQDTMPDLSPLEDQEDEANPLTAPNQEDEGVLVAAGDLHPEDFSFVYELMSEYNGHRILPSDEEWNGSAYWETYGDEFAELLGEFMIDHLERTIRYFNEKRPADYATLAKLYGWSRESRQNPEVILSTCDKISFFLSDLQERLWEDLLEENLMPLYLMGEAMSRKKD